MAQEKKLKTKLKDNEIKKYAKDYAIVSYGFFARMTLVSQIITTVIASALAYALGWCLLKFGIWMEWWGNIWYLPIIFAGIILAICLTKTIKSTSIKNKILRKIPEEDKRIFNQLVKNEYKLEDQRRQAEADRIIERQSLIRTYSDYDIQRAEAKEEQARKKEIEETLDKLNDAIRRSNNESYDIYDNRGNYIGRADKK